MAYSSDQSNYLMMASSVESDVDIESRTALFQAFSKLYDHHRELLDDMLALDDNTSSQVAHYIQGMVGDEKPHIISNLATGKSQRFDSPDGLWTIGRDPRQSDIAIRDKRLSRCHMALQYSPDRGFILSDLESTNGTHINGKKLKRFHALHDGDRIRIGGSIFYFFICSADSSEDPQVSLLSTTGSEGTLH